MGKKEKRREIGEKKKISEFTEKDEVQIDSLKDLNLENIKKTLVSNWFAQMLVALVIIGFMLRFYHLGFNSIWLDEAATLDFAQQSLSGIWQSTAQGEYNPPLFYYLEHFMLAFGTDEVLLRVLPALFGSLTIPIMYLIGKEISGRCGGIIAAGLMTFSTFHIFYSQEARAYTTMLFLFSIAVFFYLLAIRTDLSKYWILFGVFGALAFWTHFYVFVAVGVLFLHALIVKREMLRMNRTSIKQILFGIITFILVSLPLILVTVGLFLKRTASAPTWGLSGLDVFTKTILLVSGSNIFLTILFSLFAVAGVVFLYSKKDRRDLAYLLILSLILPFIVSIILSGRIPMSPRYLIYILPFYYAAIGAATGFIPPKIDCKKVAMVALVIIALFSVPYLADYYTDYSKNDWRGFSDQLSSITDEGDYVVVMPSYIRMPLDYYYDGEADGIIETSAKSSGELEQITIERGNATAYYVITGDITAANPEGDAMEWIGNNAEYLGNTMGIYLFVSNS